MNKNNEARRIELSNKILQMGQALIKEGSNQQDVTIVQSGTAMLLISTLFLNERDMFIFSELCSMFTAKKILDEAENIDPKESENFARMLMGNRATAPEAKKEEEPKKKRGRKPKGGTPETEK